MYAKPNAKAKKKARVLRANGRSAHPGDNAIMHKLSIDENPHIRTVEFHRP